MAKASVLDRYKNEIIKLISTGASIRSIWNIITSKENIDISYVSFYRYCKRKGLK